MCLESCIATQLSKILVRNGKSGTGWKLFTSHVSADGFLKNGVSDNLEAIQKLSLAKGEVPWIDLNAAGSDVPGGGLVSTAGALETMKLTPLVGVPAE